LHVQLILEFFAKFKTHILHIQAILAFFAKFQINPCISEAAENYGFDCVTSSNKYGVSCISK